MRPILIVKNYHTEGPGIIKRVLEQRNIPFDLVELDTGQEFPSAKSYGALVVLGGPDSANDQTHKMKNEVARVGEALRMGLPYLGICLGHQVLVKAYGGEITKSPVKEMGFRDPDGEYFTIEPTSDGKKDPLFKGVPDKPPVFHLHGEMVQLNNEITLLATGKYCKNQIVKIGENAYGIQCHFELDSELFAVWCKEDPDLKRLDQPVLLADYEKLKDEYEKTAITLVLNFLKIAGY